MSKEHLESKLRRALDTVKSIEAESIMLTRRLADQQRQLANQEEGLQNLMKAARDMNKDGVVRLHDAKDIWGDMMRQKASIEVTRGIVKVVAANLKRTEDHLKSELAGAAALTAELKAYGGIIEWKP